jgi:Fe-S-cluster-containing dehydrogenase component
MVIDLNKCLGCHTCQVVCKTTWSDGPGQESMYWARVTTKPYGECTVEHPNLYGDVPAGTYPATWQFYQPQLCNHCGEPVCLDVCPSGAISRRADGLVLIDQDECEGAQACVKACPYDAITYNAATKTSQKCIGCAPLIEKGEAPLCVRSCTGKARIFGDLSDPDSAVSRLVRHALPGGAIDGGTWGDRMLSPGTVRRYRPDFGTEPSVWYILPAGVPEEELAAYFGGAMRGRREEPHTVPDQLKLRTS